MDADRSAGQLHTALLRRSWPVWKPPPETKNPAPDGTGSGAVFETTSDPDNTATASLLQAGPAHFTGLVHEIARAVSRRWIPMALADCSVLASMCRAGATDDDFRDVCPKLQAALRRAVAQ